jgi:hypothetical protein
MDKIHAMQLFIRVAELESFSRAADTLVFLKVAYRAKSRPWKIIWARSCCTALPAAFSSHKTV